MQNKQNFSKTKVEDKKQKILVEKDFEMNGHKFKTGDILTIVSVYTLNNVNHYIIKNEFDFNEDDLTSLEFQKFLRIL